MTERRAEEILERFREVRRMSVSCAKCDGLFSALLHTVECMLEARVNLVHEIAVEDGEERFVWDSFVPQIEVLREIVARAANLSEEWKRKR